MITDDALLAPAVVMDARNECGHDKGGRAELRTSRIRLLQAGRMGYERSQLTVKQGRRGENQC
jgi:hypothetical protein